MKIPLMVTDLCSVQEFLKKKSKGHNLEKQRKGEQSFLCSTHPPDLKYTPIKLHEDILSCY